MVFFRPVQCGVERAPPCVGFFIISVITVRKLLRTNQHYDTLYARCPSSLSPRQQLPSETEGHAVRTDDEVKMDAEDGHESQRHQAEVLQSPSHVLRPDREEPDVVRNVTGGFAANKTLSPDSDAETNSCSLRRRRNRSRHISCIVKVNTATLI